VVEKELEKTGPDRPKGSVNRVPRAGASQAFGDAMEVDSGPSKPPQSGLDRLLFHLGLQRGRVALVTYHFLRYTDKEVRERLREKAEQYKGFLPGLGFPFVNKS